MAKRKPKKAPRKKTPSPLDHYKSLIDAWVEIRDEMSAGWMRDAKKVPNLDKNKVLVSLRKKLTADERQALGELLQHVRSGGIHDTLVTLTDAIAVDGLRLVHNGRELPEDPFGEGMHFDWVCRCEGDDWPEPDDED